MTTIALTSYKGGVGKTTSSICIATLLAKEGAKVLVIDSDPNRSASLWARPGYLPFTVTTDNLSHKVLTKEKFDHIIFDTPGRPSDDEIQELAEGCDLLILPTTPDTLSIDLIVKMCGVLPKKTAYRVLVTNSPPPPQQDGLECRNGLREAGLPVFESIIRAFKCYKNAVTEGVIVEKAKPSGGVAWGDWRPFRKELKELGV